MIEDNTISLNTIAKYAMEKRVPYQVTLELLSSCNFKCVHCYIPNHNSMGMPFEKISSLFAELKNLGTFSLVLTGGEIFLRDDIMEIVKSARDMGFSVSLLSNASLLTHKQIEELSMLNINCFSTTIFSLDEKINDIITLTPNSLCKILDNIKLMRKFGIRTEIKTPLTKYNPYSYRELIPFCEGIGSKYIPSTLITPKLDGDKATEELRLNDRQYRTVYEEIRELLEVEVTRDGDSKFGDMPCPDIRCMMSIDCKGDVFPCNSLYYKVGNVYDSSLRDIWEESETYRVLNGIKKSDLKECQGCEISNFCTRCPGNALIEDGNLLGCSTLDKRFAVLSAEKNNKSVHNE